jgi:hypothetical protein
MKKIIRLTERDLTRIVKRTIREMRFSDDEEFDSENELRSHDLCRNMEYLVHNDFPSGMLTKEKIIQILDDYMNTASRYLRKKLISSDDYEKISDCYEESISELENTEYNKLNEMEEDKSSEDEEKFRLLPEHVISSLNHNVNKFIRSQDLDKEESFRRLDYLIQRDVKPILNKAKEKGLWKDDEIDYVIKYLKIAYRYDYYSGKELPPPRENPSMEARMADRIMSLRQYGNRYDY